jgi:hypothetical protein
MEVHPSTNTPVPEREGLVTVKCRRVGRESQREHARAYSLALQTSEPRDCMAQKDAFAPARSGARGNAKRVRDVPGATPPTSPGFGPEATGQRAGPMLHGWSEGEVWKPGSPLSRIAIKELRAKTWSPEGWKDANATSWRSAKPCLGGNVG